MVLNQMMLVAVICKSINRVPSSKWEESFMKVNLHPDHHMPFDEWLKKIDSQLEGGGSSQMGIHLFIVQCRKSGKN